MNTFFVILVVSSIVLVILLLLPVYVLFKGETFKPMPLREKGKWAFTMIFRWPLNHFVYVFKTVSNKVFLGVLFVIISFPVILGCALFLYQRHKLYSSFHQKAEALIAKVPRSMGQEFLERDRDDVFNQIGKLKKGLKWGIFHPKKARKSIEGLSQLDAFLKDGFMTKGEFVDWMRSIDHAYKPEEDLVSQSLLVHIKDGVDYFFRQTKEKGLLVVEEFADEDSGEIPLASKDVEKTEKLEEKEPKGETNKPDEIFFKRIKKSPVPQKKGAQIVEQSDRKGKSKGLFTFDKLSDKTSVQEKKDRLTSSPSPSPTPNISEGTTWIKARYGKGRRLIFIAYMKGGQRQGPFYLFGRNGSLLLETSYERGIENGMRKLFNEAGECVFKGEVKKGKLSDTPPCLLSWDWWRSELLQWAQDLYLKFKSFWVQIR